MRRLAVSVALTATFLAPALAPSVIYAQPTRASNAPAPRDVADLFGRSDAEKVADEEPLTQAQILERLSRLYRYQSDILLAEARSDGQAVDALFDLAMADLGRLAAQEGIHTSPVGPRFREVYRSLVTEYEKVYNVSPDDLALQRGDVFDQRADIFAALNDAADRDNVQLEDVVLPRLRVTETTIPMPMHRLVENSIAYLLRSPERHLYGWLGRAETYFPMIERVLEEEGVPDELKYLAMIESGLNPRAASHASAVGMWQFIRQTGAAYDLQVDSYVDDRMDPEKATRAAARHLRDLYQQYGQDWHLAIAGYNCSPRGVNRAINLARQRGVARPTFWDIYGDLPRETRNYVPMFIAAAVVASNPDALDRSQIRSGPRYEYDLVPVRGSLSIETVAAMAGTTEDVIRALNPSLRRTTLPAARTHFPLRLPVGTSAAFLAASRGQSGGSTAIAYTVREGDTVTRIARQYGVSEADLRERNGITGEVNVGASLSLPMQAPVGRVDVAMNEVRSVSFDARPRMRIAAAGGAATPRPAPRATTPRPAPRVTTPRPDPAPRTTLADREETPSAPVTPVTTASTRPARERAAERTTERTERAAPAERSRASTRVSYRVRRGDTISSIAERYGVTTGQVRQWNSLSGSSLNSGRTIYLYPEGGAPAAREERASTRRAERPTTHRVARGETLAEIARETGVSMANLRAWNDLDRSGDIQAGQSLRLTASGSSRSARAERAPATHTVRSGDNLTEIAARYNVTVSQLREWNSLRGGNIRPGQRLKVRG